MLFVPYKMSMCCLYQTPQGLNEMKPVAAFWLVLRTPAWVLIFTELLLELYDSVTAPLGHPFGIPGYTVSRLPRVPELPVGPYSMHASQVED